MSWMAVAVGGSALVGAGAGIWGANKAAGAQSQAQSQALQYQQGVDQRNQGNFERGQANFAPYLGMGNRAVGQINDLYSPNGPSAGWQDFLKSPDYQFAFGQGRTALENSAASRGGLLGGNFGRAITDYGQGAASQQFGNYYNRLAGQAGMGASAAAGAAGAGASFANSSNNSANMIGNTMGNIGTANASGTVGGVNALTGGINSGMQNYAFLNYLNNNKSAYQPNTGVLGGKNMYQGTGEGWNQ